MKADREERMEIARTASWLASVALQEGERTYEIGQAAASVHDALQDWKEKMCSPASYED